MASVACGQRALQPWVTMPTPEADRHLRDEQPQAGQVKGPNMARGGE
jgi:hypothetical protein